MRDDGEHALDIFVSQDVCRIDTQDPNALIAQPFIAASIMLHLTSILMPPSVDLDRQSCGWAIEIENEGANRMLPAEMQSM
jgi:hypothetical protein